MPRKPTVIDVGRIAGVGPSTVSRYLRGANISDAAAEKVERAIRQTGYHPDENARALRVGRSRSLGVILPKISNSFFSRAVQTLEARARELGYTLLLLTHEDHPEEQAKQLATLRRCGADGAILTTVPGTLLESVRKIVGELPIVSFDAVLSKDADAVVLQNCEAARIATEHLLSHGYRRLAVVSAKPEIYSFQQRQRGFDEVLGSVGRPPMHLTGADYNEVRHMLRSSLGGNDRPDAILALSDQATLSVIQVFSELRLPPERWVPLVGFDDFDYAPLLSVPVTVVRQPVEEMLGSALGLLLKRISGTAPGAPQLIQVPGELIRRRSCGCM